MEKLHRLDCATRSSCSEIQNGEPCYTQHICTCRPIDWAKEGWFCEEHPDETFEHDGCTAPGRQKTHGDN